MGYASPFFVLLTVFISSILCTSSTLHEIICPFRSLYQFGASKSDTGNLIRVLPTVPAARLPYGVTFPGTPTGRWSDGALVVDFTARALGLPLLNPYLDTNASFDNGVNFAVAGSTALDFSFFAARGIVVPRTAPLSTQLSWFRTYLSSICSTPTECANKLRRALIYMGEIGGNDINYALTQGKSLEEIRTYVPFINQAIANATREVIQAGARRVIVPGNYPIGCFPYVLSALPSNDSMAYDKFGCLISANNLVIFQNSNLQLTLDPLRREFPGVVILYADYYAAFRTVLREAPFLGIDSRTLLKACCGVEGQYSPLDPTFCGNPNVPVCPNPNQYIHWDGIHLTQKANSNIARIINKSIWLNIKCVT